MNKRIAALAVLVFVSGCKRDTFWDTKRIIETDQSEYYIGDDIYLTLKIMTYDDLKLDDYEILNVLAAARREQAMVMIHAENHDVIRWITEKLLDQGKGAPSYHMPVFFCNLIDNFQD